MLKDRNPSVARSAVTFVNGMKNLYTMTRSNSAFVKSAAMGRTCVT